MVRLFHFASFAFVFLVSDNLLLELAQTKMKFALIFSIVLYISSNIIIVHGKPQSEILNAAENDQSKTNVSIPILRFISFPGADWLGDSIANSLECSEVAGCHKGYCWAWCGVSMSGGEWCYTSKNNYTQSHEFVECKEDSECNPCWKCGGPCALF